MLMQIDGTFIFAAISFLIFLFVIKAILYRPITKVIEERNKFYEKNSKMEAETKEKSKLLIEEKEETLRQTKAQASEILKEAVDDAKQKKEIEIKEAKKSALEKIEQNQNLLFEEQSQAKNEIKTEIANIVNSVASKVLGQEVNFEIDENKINQHLKI